MRENLQVRGLGQSIDWKLIFCYLLLVLIGWVNIYASVHSAEPSSIFDISLRCGKQFIWILTAFSLAAVILFVLPAKLWEGLSIPIFLFVLFLLVAVIFLGIEVKGSRSWFEFGPVRFQPAEVSKISTSLLLATLMSQVGFKFSRLKDFILSVLVIGVPMVVILAESETGSALVYAGFIFVMYREGLPGWWLVAIGMVILMFVTTLLYSPYVALVVLIGAIAVGGVLHDGKATWGTLGNVVMIVFLAFLPRLWGLVTGSVQEAVTAAENTYTVLPEGDDGGVLLAFLLDVKPVHFLIGLGLLSLPYFLMKAYRERDSFKALASAGFIAGLVLVFSVDFIFNNVLQDHQRKRIEVLLGLKEDPAGVGYNVNQSMIAIGSGGMTGKGFLNGTQTTYGFVPEQSTDFIFCTVGEEWGFVGSLVVIGLYVFMIARILIDAEHSRQSFTRIYGYCVASCIFMHLFINIGMTIGIMPVIGIPLPLLSYGGSSLWAFTVLIFIFIALYREEKKYF